MIEAESGVLHLNVVLVVGEHQRAECSSRDQLRDIGDPSVWAEE